MEPIGTPTLFDRRGTLTYRAPSGTDSNVGSARGGGSSSVSGLVSTLIPTLILAVVFVTVFLILRRTQARQYAPRTYLGSLRPQERTPPLSKSLFGWILEMNKLPDTYVLKHNSLDGYFLLRYLRIAVIICFLGCCFTWPILFPVNATGGGLQQQLNILSFTNIGDSEANRYYAHTFVAWVFIAFVYFMVTRESIYYINLRNAYQLSPFYAGRISSRTVLFTSVPTEYVNEAKMREIFGNRLKNIWVLTDTEKLSEKVEQRDKIAMKLEAGETKLIKLCNAARMKSIKKGHRNAEEGPAGSTDAEAESGSAASRWIKPKDRPTHRIGKFGLIGKKVDTINWSRSELQRLIPEIDAEQATHKAGEAKPSAAVFIEFYTQAEAQVVSQEGGGNKMALNKAPRVVGVTPEDVVWSNLPMNPKVRMIRNTLTISLVVLTIIYWSIPVAFVGAVSNINYLIQVAPFLKFIDNCPKVILGVITGLLPTIMLAVLMALLPIYLRFMAKMAGLPTYSAIELRTQTFYFWFQVIQVFIVTTLTSAASAAVPTVIKNPGSLQTLLAQNLPTASNFYIDYFILQGLTFSSGALLQIVGLILFKVLGKVLGSTPRKQYNHWANLSSLGWGTVMPVLSTLLVIAITYAPIAPLVLGFATVGLALFYFAFRYNLLFVNKGATDCKGLIYPRALQHTLVGCYLAMICLIGLFGIRVVKGPLVLMIVFLVICALYHAALNLALKPVLRYIPRTREDGANVLLQTEEGAAAKHADSETVTEKDGVPSNGHNTAVKDSPMEAPPPGKQNFLTKFLSRYLHHEQYNHLVPDDFAEIAYAEDTEKHAYYDPAVTSKLPILWVPRDAGGVSREECAHTSRVTPITDEAAFFDEKGNMTWDMEGTDGKPPIYEEKVYY